MDELSIFGKIRRVVTRKIPLWVLALVLAVLVGGYFVEEHVRQDHQSVHIMVNLFNYCLEKRPDCKAMFTPPQPVTAPAPPPGK